MPEGICGPRNVRSKRTLSFEIHSEERKQLLGRTALVTGASRGIGAAVALLLEEQGADVAINFRSKEARAEEIASRVKAFGRRVLLAQADLSDASGVEAMARSIERGFGEDALVSRMTEFERAPFGWRS